MSACWVGEGVRSSEFNGKGNLTRIVNDLSWAAALAVLSWLADNLAPRTAKLRESRRRTVRAEANRQIHPATISMGIPTASYVARALASRVASVAPHSRAAKATRPS